MNLPIQTIASHITLVADEKTDIVTISIGFKGSGKASLSIDQAMLSDLFAEMLQEGAGNYDKQKFQRMLYDKRIELSTSSGADHFYIHIRTLRSSLPDALKCVSAVLSKPHFKEENLSILKQQTKIGLEQSLHNPQAIAQQTLKEFVLGKNHPYAISIHQKIESLKNITPQKLRDFLLTLTRDRFYITACGHIKPEELKKWSEDLLKILPEKGPQIESKKGELQNLGKSHHLEIKVPQTTIHYAYPFVDERHPDFHALSLAIRAMAGGDFETRLMTEIREKRGWSYYCYSRLVNQNRIDFVFGGIGVQPPVVSEAIQLIRSEFKKLVEKGITKEEFQFHKDNIMGSLCIKLETTGSVASTVLNHILDGHPADHVNKISEKYAVLTLEQVNQAIKKHLNPDKFAWVTVGQSLIKAS